VDRAQLADFLRRRREALQPEDVGLPRGPRRRTAGLRREEVAALSSMSVDYLSRLEQERGPQPSEQMLASLARGLRLSTDERDHLFRIAGHPPTNRALRSDHVNPALMRVLDRLTDTPAQVVSDLGETLAQTHLAVALFGDETHFTGASRHLIYRWFTDPAVRTVYPARDHELHTRTFVSQLRSALSRNGPDPRAQTLVDLLLVESPAFTTQWNRHEVGLDFHEQKTIAHPELGEIQVHCQMLFAPDQRQAMLIFTATPGSESYEKLQLLSVIGTQSLG
jgi:transcriptional regulator with XRE-family HTH domain